MHRGVIKNYIYVGWYSDFDNPWRGAPKFCQSIEGGGEADFTCENRKASTTQVMFSEQSAIL